MVFVKGCSSGSSHCPHSPSSQPIRSHPEGLLWLTVDTAFRQEEEYPRGGGRGSVTPGQVVLTLQAGAIAGEPHRVPKCLFFHLSPQLTVSQGQKEEG
jgi:hypothetical protein